MYLCLFTHWDIKIFGDFFLTPEDFHSITQDIASKCHLTQAKGDTQSGCGSKHKPATGGDRKRNKGEER